MKAEESFRGKNALITGASQGLGAVIARIFAAEGCNVYINCAHGVEKAEAVAGDIRKRGGSAQLFQCDITDERQVSERFATLKPIDILINNARLNPYHRRPGDTESGWFAKMLAVNLIGPYLTILAAIEGMKARRWGRIVNISSIQGHVPVPRIMMPYGASKAGLNELTRCFAVEAAAYNVTVNTVSPGMIITENVGNNLTTAELEEKIKKIPLQRGADPEEIARTVLYTAKSSYMTGETVNVNGGLWLTP
ncbi:MAG: SDR family NAD(P)-dependent oxidoreductase [Kiritimatiellae bacterium]|nr:SDR family NAD(P)-dependent oxidoreductase [Kiritimatiellia bacterium]